MLQRLLACRFGPLPDAIRSRLASASTDELETWALKVFDADELDDVFARR